MQLGTQKGYCPACRQVVGILHVASNRKGGELFMSARKLAGLSHLVSALAEALAADNPAQIQHTRQQAPAMPSKHNFEPT